MQSIFVENESKAEQNKNFTICFKYPLIMFMDYVGPNEIVMVEQTSENIEKTLPAAMERHMFAT